MMRTGQILTVLLLLLTGGVLSAQDAADDNKLNVVATTTQAADAVRVIAGDTVNLTQLMGAGVDPHLYQPTESDTAAMNNADLVVYSGLNLEGKFESVLETLGERDVRVVSLGEPVQTMGFTIGGFDLSDEFQDVDDPHFWFDPRNWQISISELAQVLGEMNPAEAATYDTQAEAYNAELDLLYDWGVTALEQIPEQQRVLVTSHDAFQYFGDAFGFEVRGIQGLSTADEAGVGDIQETVTFIVDNEIPVIFVESSVPPNTVESVIEAVESQGATLQPGVRELYSDAMGAEGSFAEGYIGMLTENIVTILQSFDVEVPQLPDGLSTELPDDLLNPDVAESTPEATAEADS